MVTLLETKGPAFESIPGNPNSTEWHQASPRDLLANLSVAAVKEGPADEEANRKAASILAKLITAAANLIQINSLHVTDSCRSRSKTEQADPVMVMPLFTTLKLIGRILFNCRSVIDPDG